MNLSASGQLQINQNLRISLRLGNYGQSQRRGKDKLGQVGLQVLFPRLTFTARTIEGILERESDKYAFLSMTNNSRNTTRFYTIINVLINTA